MKNAQRLNERMQRKGARYRNQDKRDMHTLTIFSRLVRSISANNLAYTTKMALVKKQQKDTGLQLLNEALSGNSLFSDVVSTCICTFSWMEVVV